MKAGVLALAVLMVDAWHGSAWAQGWDEERMEQRFRYLEQRIVAQDWTIIEKDRQISRLAEMEHGWFNNVSVGGAVEIEAVAEEDYDGANTNGFETASVDVTVEAKLVDRVGVTATLTMDDGGVIEVDEAFVTLTPADAPVSIQLGKQGLPFGIYESGLISDELAEELGDTRKDAALLGVEIDGVNAYGFLFRGSPDGNGDDTAEVRNFGLALGYAMETDAVSLSVDLSCINDIGESDTVDEAIAETASSGKVPGGAASVIGSFGGMTVIAEYVTALEDFDADELAYRSGGAKPSAWGVEAGYGWEMYGRWLGGAIAWQQTIEAQALDLPESRFLVGFTIGLTEGFGLALEYRRENDYGAEDGGTGNAADAVTVQFAAEF